MKDKSSDKNGKKPSASFVIGAIALLFLIVGYQTALFIHKASVAKVISNHDKPDTVYVATGHGVANGYPSDDYASNSNAGPGQAYYRNFGDGNSSGGPASYGQPRNGGYGGRNSHDGSSYGRGSYGGRNYQNDRQNSSSRESGENNYAAPAKSIRRNYTERVYESFPFDPNTVSIDDLMRLGFSEKQALSIDNYRKKGGRFRRKEDFAKSYVVADSVYKRLEPYIDIPKIDINAADSTLFETLPGIGPFFAAKMVSYRSELRGYSYPEQLMDIWHFDEEKFGGLKDLITIVPETSRPYPIWTLPEDSLALHPYIDKQSARAIVIFRENSPSEDWTMENLLAAGIFMEDKAAKISKCLIAKP